MKFFSHILAIWAFVSLSGQALAQDPIISLGRPQIIAEELDPSVFTMIKLQDYLAKYGYPASTSKTCDAGDVLVFDTLSDFHTQLRRLNRHYINNDEDDLVLSAYEVSKPLSSLRMEIERLDGANVAHTLENITSDNVFAAMLNQNGFYRY